MFSSKEFLDAIDGLVAAKGIKKEKVVEIIKESLEKGYRKQLGQSDALVRCDIDGERGTIDLYYIRNVVEEVTDDFLEISVEDAKALDKKGSYKVGDQFLEKASLDELKKVCANATKSGLLQRLAEAEKELLYDLYKDKVGTMIFAHVERVEDNGLSISIASNAVEKTTLFVPRKELIPNETFKAGDKIRLYVNNVENDERRGMRISLSRTSKGFLKTLFEEEIHEIADGTVIIKDIARQAGERSKVSVYSLDPNVEPAGTCIGPMGSRIQRVISQLGNAPKKERIDIINYSDNPALYIMDALKPSKVLGIQFDADNNSAICIVPDDNLSLAVGLKGINVRLAVLLTGYAIDIKTESDAIKEGITYQTFAEIEALAKQAKAAARLVKPSEESSRTAPIGTLPEGYVAPSARTYKESTVEISDEERETLESEIDDEEISSAVNDIVLEETSESDVAPKEDKVEVKTTTTLESLEKQLAEESKKKTVAKRNTKKKEETKEEDKVEEKKDTQPKMAIYTEEELRQMEEEDANAEDDSYDDEEEDYDEYDDYYDDEK